MTEGPKDSPTTGTPAGSGRAGNTLRLLGRRRGSEPDGTGAPELKGGRPDRPARTRPVWSPLRVVVTWVLVVLMAVLVPLSVTTFWAVGTITKTDKYVETVAPIVREKVVTDRIAIRATNVLFEKADVQGRLEAVLPKPLDVLAAPVTSELHTIVRTQLTRVLQSTWFQDFWDDLNRRAHANVVGVLTGHPTPTAKRVNRVFLNVTPVLTKAIDQLDQRGIHTFDGVRSTIDRTTTLRVQLVNSKQLAKAQGLFAFISDLGWGLPLGTLVLLVVAVAVAVDRRKALLRATIAAAVGTVGLLSGLVLARSFFLSRAATRGVDVNAAGTVFDVVVRYLRGGLRWAVLVEMLVALCMVLIGPSRPARSLRHGVASSVRFLMGLATGYARAEHPAAARRFLAATGWAEEHRRGLRIAGAAVAGSVLVLWTGLSVGAFWALLIALAAYLVVLEVLLAWARHLLARNGRMDDDGGGGGGGDGLTPSGQTTPTTSSTTSGGARPGA